MIVRRDYEFSYSRGRTYTVCTLMTALFAVVRAPILFLCSVALHELSVKCVHAGASVVDA